MKTEPRRLPVFNSVRDEETTVSSEASANEHCCQEQVNMAGHAILVCRKDKQDQSAAFDGRFSARTASFVGPCPPTTDTSVAYNLRPEPGLMSPVHLFGAFTSNPRGGMERGDTRQKWLGGTGNEARLPRKLSPLISACKLCAKDRRCVSEERSDVGRPGLAGVASDKKVFIKSFDPSLEEQGTRFPPMRPSGLPSAVKFFPTCCLAKSGEVMGNAKRVAHRVRLSRVEFQYFKVQSA
ncbi:hypothetical protein Bbelb_017350 [Branchiostoma belcheri]|nr:hypothetical protein Bbelb_017350 [Branchiostoma belcheri]